MLQISEWLEPLKPHMGDANEININGYGGFFVVNGSTTWVDCDSINYEWCYGLADMVGTYSSQAISGEDPIMSAHIDTGERIEIVMPPLVREPVVSIRIPSEYVFTLDDFDFLHDDMKSELIRIVQEKQTLIVSGGTFSGKSALLSSLISFIPPGDRIISIEDAHELNMPIDSHPNQIRLQFNRSEQRQARVTTREILRSTLRQNPDWLLLGEVRDKEAFEFLNAANTGHHAMTTLHADSGVMALTRMATLVGMSAPTMTHDQIMAYLSHVVHAIVQVSHDKETNRRTITEIYYPGSDK